MSKETYLEEKKCDEKTYLDEKGDEEYTIFDKIGIIVEEHINRKNQIILEILTSCIEKLFDEGSIEASIEEDIIDFEIISTDDLNLMLEEHEFEVDEAYLKKYLSEGFYVDDGVVFYAHIC